MSIALTLLEDVRWRGVPVAGDRPQALLAALAARDCRPVGSAELIELVWGDEAPSNGMKSLQVLVSRTRSACGADAIVRDGAGYRLGAAPGEVDSIRLSGLVREAASALDGDAARAAELAREALALAGGLGVTDEEAGPLAEVRRAAAADAVAARVILARATSRTGAHADAHPKLELAYAGSPHDESLLADLLRSEAAVRGPAVALERFEHYRRDLRDRLTFGEAPAGVRYRMLETVREFGRRQLGQAGEENTARAAQRRWAVGYANAQQSRVTGATQFAAVDALAAEETNLADELRAALADGDRGSLVQLLAVLSLFWTIRGEHIRVLVLAEAVVTALREWQPPPELADATRAAVAVIVNNTLLTGGASSGALLALLRRLGPAQDSNLYVAGAVRVLLASDPADPEASLERLERLSADSDRHVAAAASQWLSHERENSGDPAGAFKAAQRALALARDEDGPWARAMAHSQLAELAMHLGDHAAGVEHARSGLPVMRRLGAGDDEIQLQAVLVLCAIAEGRLADAADELDRVERIDDGTVTFGGIAFRRICRAELLLAAGDFGAGLALYRECAVRMREFEFPGVARTGNEPWATFGDAIALAAHAHYATGSGDETQGRALFSACRDGALKVFGEENAHLDYPASGLLLFALGAWSLLRQAGPAEDALRLLALAARFAYSRANPTMAWERIIAPAQEAAPGLLARLLDQYRECPLPGLVEEARQAVERLTC